MQTKLTEEQIENLRLARNGISAGIPWFSIGQAEDFWNQAFEFLDDMVKHGTSDGKPYVEPEPPIPEGYRKANADEWKRKDVKFWSVNDSRWNDRPAQGSKFDAPIHGTRYIVPIEPPLTDEDACVWPRLLVMVRDENYGQWKGPFVYKGKDDDTVYPFVAASDRGRSQAWKYARRATPEEIKAAK